MHRLPAGLLTQLALRGHIFKLPDQVMLIQLLACQLPYPAHALHALPVNAHPYRPGVFADKADLAIKLAVGIKRPANSLHQVLVVRICSAQGAHRQPRHFSGLVTQNSGGLHAHALHLGAMRHDQAHRGIVHQRLQLQLQLTLSLAMHFIASPQSLQCRTQGLRLTPVMIRQGLPPVGTTN